MNGDQLSKNDRRGQHGEFKADKEQFQFGVLGDLSVCVSQSKDDTAQGTDTDDVQFDSSNSRKSELHQTLDVQINAGNIEQANRQDDAHDTHEILP